MTEPRSPHATGPENPDERESAPADRPPQQVPGHPDGWRPTSAGVLLLMAVLLVIFWFLFR